MLSLIGTIVVGLVVGLIARALKPGDDSMGLIMTIILGIAGSLLAGYAGRALGWYQPGQAAGWIASIIGAIILLTTFAVQHRGILQAARLQMILAIAALLPVIMFLIFQRTFLNSAGMGGAVKG